MINEVVRRLRNCEKVEDEVLSAFSQKMRNSGYGAEFRRQVIAGGVKVDKEQRRREEEGGRPMFRSRNFEKDERRRAKRQNRFN